MSDFSVSIGADLTAFDKALIEAQTAVQRSFRNVSADGLERVVRNLSVSLTQIGANAEIFGRTVETNKKQLAAYQAAFNDLAGQGIKPTHPEMLQLADDIRRVTAEIAKAETPVERLKTRFEKLGEAGDKLQSIGTKLSVGLTAPLSLLGGAAVKAYSELEGVKVAFDRLNNPNLLNDLRKSTNNTVADITLMKNTVQASNFGLPVKELGNLFEFAGRRAKDTGQSVDYLVDSIVSGIGRKSPLILDNLGISASALKAALGGVSMETASVAQVTEAVGKIIEKELAKMGKETVTLSDQFNQLKTIGQNALTRIGEIIAPMLKPVVEFATKIANVFQDMSPEMQKAIVVIGGVAAAIGPLAAGLGTVLKFLPLVKDGFKQMRGALLLISSPAALIAAALAGIITLVVQNWGKIKPYFDATVRNLKEMYNESKVLQAIVKIVGVQFKLAFAAVPAILNGVLNTIKSFGKAALEIFAGLGQVIRGVWDADWETIKKGYTRAANGMAQGIVGAIGAAKGAWNDFKDNLTGRGGAAAVDIPVTVGAGGMPPEDQLEAVHKKVKNKAKNLPPIELEVLKVTPRGFINVFREEFATLREYENRARELHDRVADNFNLIPISINAAAEKAKIEFANYIDQLNAAADGIFQTGILDIGAAIGESLVNGTNILAAGAGAILNTLSQFAFMFAKELVKTATVAGVFGKLMLAIRDAVKNPIALIGIAAAAAAVGAALAAAAKKTANAGGGGGSVSSSAGGNSWSGSSSYYNQNNQGGGNFVFRISGYDLVSVLEKNQNRNNRTNAG